MISIPNHTIRKHILSKIDNLGIFETQFSQNSNSSLLKFFLKPLKHNIQLL